MRPKISEREAVEIALKTELLHRRLSMTALADRIGVRREEVSQCIRGYRPHFRIRKLIARELGVPEDRLFSSKTAARRNAA